MAYAIARVSKLKGPSVVSSGKHVDRERETPNADPDRRHENRVLVGDGRSLREVVTEKIGAHGGKPRRDSVECVEMMFTASHEFFFDDEEVLDRKKVSAFSEKTVEFLREKYGDRCVKADLHMDEYTPHIHAFMVPINGRGQLNCKSFFGTRDKFRQFQTEYARKMGAIGLERGVEHSRARHTDVQRFYGTIMEMVEMKIDHAKIPDPPKFMMTDESQRDYKLSVIEAVNEHITNELTVMRNQAMLAVSESRKRAEAEKRAEERIQEAERWAEERVENAEKTTETAVSHYMAEHEENQLLKQENESLQSALASETHKTQQLNEQVQSLRFLLRDIPPREVMIGLTGHRGEQQGELTIYRGMDDSPAIVIFRDKAYNHENKLVARNAVELVMCVGVERQGDVTAPRDAISYLADEFGKDRAVAAALVYTRDTTAQFIDERIRHGRSRSEVDSPVRADPPAHDDHEALMH